MSGIWYNGSAEMQFGQRFQRITDIIFIVLIVLFITGSITQLNRKPGKAIHFL